MTRGANRHLGRRHTEPDAKAARRSAGLGTSMADDPDRDAVEGRFSPCVGGFRAYDLLASQPISLAGLSATQRKKLIISAIADEDGNEYPVCWLGDAMWDLRPKGGAKNRRASLFKINWPADVPEALIDDVKAALYCALRRGRNGGRPWSAVALAQTAQLSVVLLRYLCSLGLMNFGQVRAIHLSDHIADLRRSIQAVSVRSRLEIIDLIRVFRADMLHPLPEHPWCGRSFHHACGCNEGDRGPTGRTGKTPVIPRSIQRAIFSYCEAILDGAEAVFRARDAGEIGLHNPRLTAIRDAVLYLLQVTTGMRNSESTGVTNGCWRTEVINGVAHHWVRTREFKTTGGKAVDFLVPPEAIRALEILRRYAEPLQMRLSDEKKWIRQQLESGEAHAGKLRNGMTLPEAVARLNHVSEIGEHLLLCVSKVDSDHMNTGSRVDVLATSACNSQLKVLARSAGVDWPLANHQCRRTFAYNVANSRLGRMGLIFLKWQLKHASMSWTQLYASNPLQDQALYREFEAEMTDARVALLSGWLQEDALLSGGAGRKIMQTRAKVAGDHGQLLRLTAESVELRSTGHAWCISGTQGCHGQGIYDPSMCGPCSQAIIDADMSATWQMIHLDNLRLASIADCGPAVAQRAARAIERSARVLEDLGVQAPSAEQAASYASAEGAA